VLAVAVLGIVMVSMFDRNLNERLAKMNLSPGIRQELNAQRIKLAGMEIPHEIDARTTLTIHESIQLAFVGGFRVVMLIGSALALLSAAAAWLMIENSRS
jgi:hypothetical protein